jgi:hypothetical protein
MGSNRVRSSRSRYARVEIGGNFNNLMQYLDGGLRQDVAKEMEKIALDSAEVMRNKIRTSGTDFSDDARTHGLNSGPGRVRTGRMLDDVSVRTESFTKKTYINFGWVRRFQKYYSYQETGFRNYWARGDLLNGGKPDYMGDWIWTPGMFALFDARAYADRKVKALYPKILKMIRQSKGGV